ncbi:hypothetical protein GCM10009347_26880 [Shewanella algicola]|uniref:S49 family peptidase n=1 Tax=Shewanella algicola TaxID=640633 RepID=A0A9X1Z6V8_9GAMM|nr:S49 family peptidase [Shewanella algicola]MCL1106339.1 S49 family peptidase [Shewanella algicola]GGP59087.1 hypothetical protein GCM10009347_26880 [Shewanella algicola]
MLLGGIIFIGFLGNLITMFTPEKSHVAMIQINGEIGTDHDTGNGEKIAQHLLTAMSNDDAQMIVIKANSPGGSPTDSQTINEIIVQYKQWKSPLPKGISEQIINDIENPVMMFQEDFTSSIDLKTLPRKLIVAVVIKQCASACVQAIINADVIIGQRASLIGNIGVRLDRINFSDFAKNVGVTNTTITSGQYKAMLNPWHAIDSEELDIAKTTLIEPVFEQFKADVLAARAEKFKLELDTLFSGLVWTGDEAQRIGLIDGVSNPVAVKSALEKISKAQYKEYSIESFSLGAFIKNPFASMGYL